MARLSIAAVVAIGLGVGAFFAGRGSVDSKPSSAPARPGSYTAGYRAGREAAFSGFDGGWAYGVPYVVTVRRGPPGITYAFATRRPLRP